MCCLSLRLGTLAPRRVKSILKHIYECIHELVPTQLCKLLKPIQYQGHQARAQDSANLCLPYYIKNVGIMSTREEFDKSILVIDSCFITVLCTWICLNIFLLTPLKYYPTKVE